MSGPGNSQVIKNNTDKMILPDDLLYEDTHLIAINKKSSRNVQADKTGDTSLESLVREYIKIRHKLQGEIYLGIIHRIDRRASGVVLFARTGEALAGMNRLFREGQVRKTYWAITKNIPADESGRLEHYLKKNEKLNKSYAYPEPAAGSKLSILSYKVVSRSDRYNLLEIDLLTGRHHQIRCQLAYVGCPVRGDLKYGYPRSNEDGSISLHARSLAFIHPVTGEPVVITAPAPPEKLWKILSA
jgi:23S rRNA pseudouridine1911/1915/1917 synthase